MFVTGYFTSVYDATALAELPDLTGPAVQRATGTADVHVSANASAPAAKHGIRQRQVALSATATNNDQSNVTGNERPDLALCGAVTHDDDDWTQSGVPELHNPLR